MNKSSKTLLQILVDELPKRGGWPKSAVSVVQDSDLPDVYVKNKIKFAGDGFDIHFDGENWVGFWEFGCSHDFGVQTLASDYATAIITRDQYEAALAASKRCDHKWIPSEGRTTSGYLCSKCGNYDGPGYDWIDWHGGECPVPVGTLVDVKHRDGDFGYECLAGTPDKMGEGRALAHRWNHQGTRGDIIAYRLCPQQDANTRANDDRLAQDTAFEGVSLRHRRDGFETPKASTTDAEADLNECIGQAVPEWDGKGLPPVGQEVEWRERIHWYPGFVTAVGEQLIVIKDRHGNEGAYQVDNLDFRPATFQRDELAATLEKLAHKYSDYKDLFKLTAADLLAAGYRKQ